MSGNVQNYGRMKEYENGSEREEGEEEMGYLRGKDTAKGFKAVNPPFLKRCGFFSLLLSSITTSSPSPLDHKHITDTNINAQTHSNRRSPALPIKSSHLYGIA